MSHDNVTPIRSLSVEDLSIAESHLRASSTPYVLIVYSGSGYNQTVFHCRTLAECSLMQRNMDMLMNGLCRYRVIRVQDGV